ncbi:MAG: hypothetical protein KDA59_12060 [Planctomycetales bacterium]|nr:hypothetical protein [Planctomycetales bacterium]
MLDRRELLEAAVAVGGATLLSRSHANADEQPAEAPHSDTIRIVDTNVSLFQWPFRRLPLDETERLVGKLRELRIAEAWASSFEGLLHRDISGVNLRLARVCERFSELVPIGCLNLGLPDWEEDLRRCSEEHHMPGVRVYPNYHGYSLDDERFVRLLQLATSAGLFVQIAVAMEDVRTQHPLVQVADVDLAPLSDTMSQAPDCRVQLLNYRPQAHLMSQLIKVAGLYFDVARVDGTQGITKLMQVASNRVMLGSHAPFLIPEAALIRVDESELGEVERRSLLSGNSQRFGRREVL